MNSLILWAALSLVPFVPAAIGVNNAGCGKCDCCGCCDTGDCRCETCTCKCCGEGCDITKAASGCCKSNQ